MSKPIEFRKVGGTLSDVTYAGISLLVPDALRAEIERLQAIEADWVRRGVVVGIAEKALLHIGEGRGNPGFVARDALVAMYEAEQAAPQGEVKE